ncbi:hypothetical protein EVAR_54550_1 [Eumeta japonica]|uniref:Uncharacterized protein n=1 Tax=Eumeta variegata TaxID=151549 RepID=A0A4C1YVT1_EUMVA|nr:hypothetical protein EVAR_54550_1 [Eumeta japonica]
MFSIEDRRLNGLFEAWSEFFNLTEVKVHRSIRPWGGSNQTPSDSKAPLLGTKELASHQRNVDHRRPWTLATPNEIPMRYQFLGKEKDTKDTPAGETTQRGGRLSLRRGPRWRGVQTVRDRRCTRNHKNDSWTSLLAEETVKTRHLLQVWLFCRIVKI